MSDCTHDLTEREVACADGYCPLCSAARVSELEAERNQLRARVESMLHDDWGSLTRERDALRALLRAILAGISGPFPTPLQWKAICDKAREIDAALKDRHE